MRKGLTVDQRLKKPPSSPPASPLRDKPSFGDNHSSNSEMYFRALSENSLVGEYVVQDGRALYVNPALARIFGYSPPELVGQEPLILIHPEDRPSVAKKLNDTPAGKIQPPHFECRGMHKDGHAIDIEVQGNVAISLNGRPARIGTLVEITRRKQAEKQLQKLTRAVEQSPATVVITDGQGRIEFVNPKFNHLTGYTTEEVLGRNSSILKSHLTPASTYQELWETILGGREWRGEFINRKKNGELYWESASISAIKNAAGDITHFIAVKEDISERKKAEEALRKSEEESRRLIAEAAEGIFRTSPEGKFILANPAAAKILGYASAEEFVASISDSGLQVWENPEERQQVKGLIEEQGAVRGYECRFRRKDSTTIWVSLNARKSLAPDGRTQYYQGSFEDITERRRAREALEEAHRKLARSMEILKSRSTEIFTLSELGRLLQSCLNREEAYRIIKAYCQKLFPSFSGGVYLTAASRNVVQIVTSWGESGASQPVFAPDECWALRSGRLHCVAEENAPMLCGHMPPMLEVSYLCLPLMAQAESMGILHIECHADAAAINSDDWGEFKKSRQELASAVAEHVALALANLQLRETLRSQSIRDPLTGLFNRRYMEESLAREVLRASRTNSTIGILLVDIDHFKQYNDTFGHEAGDAVMKEVGALLQKQVRGEDIACRFGGEEFLLILPGAPLEIAHRRAEHLRRAVSGLTVGFHGQALGSITVSIGVAIYPLHGSKAESVLECADKALYSAKESGRDRTVVAAPIVEQDWSAGTPGSNV
jgi:diguanylate cyclase (GGDEF)-like protein/PAS domain S-box-containing protein